MTDRMTDNPKQPKVKRKAQGAGPVAPAAGSDGRKSLAKHELDRTKWGRNSSSPGKGTEAVPLSSKEARRRKREEKKRLEAERLANLEPACAALFLSSPDLDPVAPLVDADGETNSMAADNSQPASVTMNHSTHVDGLIRTLRKLLTNFGSNGVRKVTPGKLRNGNSHAEHLSLRVQREASKPTSYKVVARNGHQVQDVFIVVDAVLVPSAADLQDLIDRAIKLTESGGGDVRDAYGDDMLGGGPLNATAEQLHQRLKERNAAQKLHFEAKRVDDATRRHQTEIQKHEKRLKSKLSGADRKKLGTRAELNAGLTTGEVRRGKGGFGGRSKQIAPD
eukprot:m.179487 g.179487  ORF g.179487 m.179487 type:complete len:335 (+) comp14772_c0_seq1:242-1246(+)